MTQEISKEVLIEEAISLIMELDEAERNEILAKYAERHGWYVG